MNRRGRKDDPLLAAHRRHARRWESAATAVGEAIEQA
jgi:hypothetical protein